jgi:hypothetical protein
MPRVSMSDAIAQAFSIDKNKPCQCGRPNAYIHCPHCGSTSFYALREKSSQAVSVAPNGAVMSVRMFNCRACLDTFAEDDCSRNCKADPSAAFQREKEVVHKLTGGLHTKAFENKLLEEYLTLHPERRPKKSAPEVNKVTGSVGFLEQVDVEREARKDGKS